MQSTNSIFGNQELSDLNKQLWSEDFISILLLVHIFTVPLSFSHTKCYGQSLAI